jgi:superfamily II DNA or RNA helicase
MLNLELEFANRGKIKFESQHELYFSLLYEIFSIPNPKVKHSTRARKILNPINITGSYPAGLTYDIIKNLKRLNIPFTISDDLQRTIRPIIYNGDIIIPANDKFVYRDYQLEAIKKCMKFGRGIVLLPTSSGKSLVIYGLIKNLQYYYQFKRNILIITPNIQLVTQLQKDFIDYGENETNIQMFSSFSADIDKTKSIFISNRQWLAEHSKEMPYIDMVLVDECQQLIKENNISNYVMKLKTPVKFGFTGTLPEDIYQERCIKGLLGPVVITEEITNLQDKKIIANINIIAFKIKHLNKPVIHYASKEEYKKAFWDEYQYIEACEESIQKISKIAMALKGNTLILTDHIEYNNKLFEKINSEHKYLIDGSTDLDNREDIRTIMEERNDIITVSNCKCFGTGINIKNIHNIILAISGKSAIKVIQAIGRGLRLNTNKSKLNLIDIHHNFRYSQYHFLKRKLLYQEFYNKKITEVKTIIIGQDKSDITPRLFQ